MRLLFLQQCARASIQNLYNFIDSAEYILASPLELWPPSTYYSKTLKFVTNSPNTSGKNVAENIMNEDEQYEIYTLISNIELKKLPEKLKPVLESFAKESVLKPPQTCVPVFEFEDEKFYDLKSYFQTLSSQNNYIADNELNTFFDWCDNHLITSKRIKDYKPPNSQYKPVDESWRCGLSIFVPTGPNQIGRYDYLPLYKYTKLENLMRLTLE